MLLVPLAIPPEPPVAIISRCTAAHSRQGRAGFARRSEPLPASTDVRPTQLDGRLGGVAAILLVSSEQVLANSAGVR